MTERSTAVKKQFESLAANSGFILLLYFIDRAFVELYLISFGGVVKASDLGSHPVLKVNSSQGFYLIILMYLLLSRWQRPFSRFVAHPDPELKEKVRLRIRHIYRDMFLFFGIVAAANLAIYAVMGINVSWMTFLKVFLPAKALSFAAQICVALIYFDLTLLRSEEVMGAIYDRDELYRVKEGLSLPIYAKLTLLVTVCGIVPLILIPISVDNVAHTAIAGSGYIGVVIVLVCICVFTLLYGMKFIFAGFQAPLNGLIEKMRRVARGNYDVKSRIYFNDEVAHLKAGFNEMVDGLKEREELRDTFGRYMSIEIARELLKNKKVTLGGEHIEAAVMFCDIRNFTPLSEKMTPSEVVAFLNEYFSYITPPITANSGVISKFMGDAVMAVYAPTLGAANYAVAAVRSALAMRKGLEAFNASGKGPGEVRFGVGIQTGGLVAGNIGTMARLEYTFIGDTVNIASRLESKTKELGTDILISRSVLEKIGGALDGEARFEKAGLVPLKGKAEPMELYKVV